jgi:MFS family permease
VSTAPKPRERSRFSPFVPPSCAQLDTSVVNLAVRPISSYFHANARALQWVVDSYNLVYAALLLTGGLLADLYGRRLVFMASAAVFKAASLLCVPSLPRFPS